VNLFGVRVTILMVKLKIRWFAQPFTYYIGQFYLCLHPKIILSNAMNRLYDDLRKIPKNNVHFL